MACRRSRNSPTECIDDIQFSPEADAEGGLEFVVEKGLHAKFEDNLATSDKTKMQAQL